jgi:hypothetical protein
VLLGDPNRVNTDLAKLQAVTAADVQRVMKQYFTAGNRLVIYYLPEAAKTNTTRSTTNGRNEPQRAAARPATSQQTGGQGR